MTKTMLATLLTTAIAATSALAMGASRAHAGGDDWDKDWTALTVSSNGAWGSAMHALRTTAMIQATAECRERAGGSGGCGSHTTTVRNAWTVAYLCGSETFIVTARTYREAQFAALNQEIELRDFERIAIGDCRRIVAIDPGGKPASADALSAVVPLIPGSPEISASENLH